MASTIPLLVVGLHLLQIGAHLTCKVIEACPDAGWQLIVALRRYGGLRCLSEHLTLRLDDVDWEHDRILITSPKTARQVGHESRMIPIFPELRPYLEVIFHAADPGTEYFIMRYQNNDSNLRTQMTRIVNKAGLKTWPRIFRNLRSSRQTELEEFFPSHVVCKWIGNSPQVARKALFPDNGRAFRTSHSRRRKKRRTCGGKSIAALACSRSHGFPNG